MQKGMFWVSEQRLVDQANRIRRNSWMTELEIEELESKVTGSDSVILEARSVEALPDHVLSHMFCGKWEQKSRLIGLMKKRLPLLWKLQK